MYETTLFTKRWSPGSQSQHARFWHELCHANETVFARRTAKYHLLLIHCFTQRQLLACMILTWTSPRGQEPCLGKATYQPFIIFPTFSRHHLTAQTRDVPLRGIFSGIARVTIVTYLASASTKEIEVIDVPMVLTKHEAPCRRVPCMSVTVPDPRPVWDQLGGRDTKPLERGSRIPTPICTASHPCACAWINQIPCHAKGRESMAFDHPKIGRPVT
jgi:hypothetical protein